jgi:hypothetical protein
VTADSTAKAMAKGTAKAKINQHGVIVIDDKEDNNGNQSMGD